MSEEVKNASTTIPRTMLSVYIINFVLLFPAILTVAYHVPDLDAALNDSTTYPAIYVLKQSMSVGWINLLLVLIILINVASNIVYLAAVTRDLFAFSRDKGLPFSRWLSSLDAKRHIPVNAARFSCLIAFLLALIYIGSPVAFYAITALNTVALLQCYTFSIGCVLWRRIAHPETLPTAAFSLGRFGVPVNAFAVIYSMWSLFWACWPQQYPVTASGFNWASPIFIAVVLGSLIYFAFKARHTYEGPVVMVEGRKAHAP
ncbi:hypothetical protein LTR86_006824 [Recurvomyces mirabilis]|nr:hypothetical protein LTR86_006824 [Recurvomyces mirabilis]